MGGFLSTSAGDVGNEKCNKSDELLLDGIWNWTGRFFIEITLIANGL